MEPLEGRSPDRMLKTTAVVVCSSMPLNLRRNTKKLERGDRRFLAQAATGNFNQGITQTSRERRQRAEDKGRGSGMGIRQQRRRRDSEKRGSHRG